jgi:hypothetical protein
LRREEIEGIGSEKRVSERRISERQVSGICSLTPALGVVVAI